MTNRPTSSSSLIGMLVVISGPSGVGKTTIVHEVIKRMGGVFSVSTTTRPKGQTEIDGRDYFFISESKFDQMLGRGEFLEYAKVFGRHWYGTPREPVERMMREGKMIVLDIDVQGAKQVKDAMPESFAIFILPPNEEELLRRLRARARDDDDAIQRRFAEAREEIRFARNSSCYDAFVINDDLETSIASTIDLINARKRRETIADSNADNVAPSNRN